MDLNKLADFFPESDLEWRVQRAGVGNKPWAHILVYVTARGVMDRLDEVCGPGNWCDAYDHLPNGIMCTIGIKTEDGWVYKQNGAPETAVESFKGGISKAFVRCAVNWGIGRYLYKFSKIFAEIGDESKKYNKEWNWLPKEKFAWKAPPIPIEFRHVSDKQAPLKKQTAEHPRKDLIKDLGAAMKRYKWDRTRAEAHAKLKYGVSDASDMTEKQLIEMIADVRLSNDR